MKKYFLLFTGIIAALILFSGCSKEDNPIESNEPADDFVWVHFEGDSTKFEFSTLPKIDVEEGLAKGAATEAIRLSAFVDTTLIPMFKDKDGIQYESRNLYAYRIAGDDGFSASTKGYLDNTWEDMQIGYILVDSRKTVFPDDIKDLPGAYNIKETRHIRINRKIDIAAPDTTGFVQLPDVQIEQVENHDGQMEDAVSLQNIISVYVTDAASHTYTYSAIDGYGPSADLTWAQFSTGYWLLESEKTIFTDPGLVGGAYKIKALQTITVK